MARRGRRAKSKEQKVKDALDRAAPNIRVQERQSMFAGLERDRPIEYVKAPSGELRPIDQSHDTIGQFFLVGLLDGHGYEASELLAKGRFWGGYIAKAYKNVGVKTAAYERRDRSEPSTATTPEDLFFERMDESLWRDSGGAKVTTYERDVLWDLIVHPLIGHLNAAPWAQSLIDEALLQKGRNPRLGQVIMFPTSHERGMLDAVIRGLCCLCEGSLPGRYERRVAA